MNSTVPLLVPLACRADGKHLFSSANAIVVGSELFVTQIKQKMGIKLMKKTIGQVVGAHVLHEPESAYSVHLEGEKASLSYENTVYFDENAE